MKLHHSFVYWKTRQHRTLLRVPESSKMETNSEKTQQWICKRTKVVFKLPCTSPTHCVRNKGKGTLHVLEQTESEDRIRPKSFIQSLNWCVCVSVITYLICLVKFITATKYDLQLQSQHIAYIPLGLLLQGEVLFLHPLNEIENSLLNTFFSGQGEARQQTHRIHSIGRAHGQSTTPSFPVTLEFPRDSQ